VEQLRVEPDLAEGVMDAAPIPSSPTGGMGTDGDGPPVSGGFIPRFCGIPLCFVQLTRLG